MLYKTNKHIYIYKKKKKKKLHMFMHEFGLVCMNSYKIALLILWWAQSDICESV